jgi:hypothetical protein
MAAVTEALQDLTWRSHAESTWFRVKHCLRRSRRSADDTDDDDDSDINRRGAR